jgi:hypothetical protein
MAKHSNWLLYGMTASCTLVWSVSYVVPIGYPFGGWTVYRWAASSNDFGHEQSFAFLWRGTLYTGTAVGVMLGEERSYTCHERRFAVDGWALTGRRSETGLPVWPVAVSLCVATAICLCCAQAVRTRAERRAQLGLCPACGYDLRASPLRCPECGREANRHDTAG